MSLNLNVIYSHNLSVNKITPDKKEILRYMGQKGDTSPEIIRLIDNNIKTTLTKATPKGAFVIRNMILDKSHIKIGESIFNSENLSKNLMGCKKAIIFTLTLGIDADRAIQSKKALSPLESLIASSVFTDILEKYADIFTQELEEELSKNHEYLVPRFSPGYGDFSLENQPEFIKATDSVRRCGVSVTDSMMLIPSKSITGIIGISQTKRCNVQNKCDSCSKTDCNFRNFSEVNSK